MRAALRITVFLLALGSSQGVALSQEKAPEQIVRDIVSAWKAKHSEVKTIVCQATVDAFIPAGGYTNQSLIWVPEYKDIPPYPKEDTWVKGESASWALDFQGGRARKEWRLTRPNLLTAHAKECSMVLTTGIKIFADKKFRHFRPRDGSWTDEERANKALAPDVTVYDEYSHQAFFSFGDLPLLWYAGGVTGRYPLPDQMRELDAPKRFNFRGQTEYNGRKCFVLTVPDQGEEGGAVRELYVDTQPPHLIYSERARQNNHVFWTIEAKYHLVDGQ